MAFGKREETPEPIRSVTPPPSAPAREGTSILAANVHFDGTMTGGGMVRIEGDFKGKIVHEGQLVIAESANVKASIQANQLIIFGRVQGDVVTGDLLELKPTARLVGSIRSARVVMSDGASLIGNADIASKGAFEAYEVSAEGSKAQGEQDALAADHSNGMANGFAHEDSASPN